MDKLLAGVRVLVTGAGGFVGSHLSRRLVKKGAKVHLLDRMSYVSEKAKRRLADIWDEVKIYDVDIGDMKALSQAIEDIKPDKIYHLAAYTNSSRDMENVEPAVKINFQGTLNLLNALAEGSSLPPYECLVNTSTAEEYGNNPTPFSEEQRIAPLSPYATSKAAARLFCDMYYKIYNFPIVTLRPFIIYGPHQDPSRFIPQVILSCLRGEDFEMTKGEQTRDFTYVDDIVEANLKASLSDKAIGQTINVGTGEPHSLVEVATEIISLMGSKIKLKAGALGYRPGEVWRSYGDNSKAYELLGWKAEIDLREGLRRTISWFKAK